METDKKKLRQKLQNSLKKLNTKKEQIDNLINDIEGIAKDINNDLLENLEGLTEELNSEKPLKTNYGTSCIRLEKIKTRTLLTEY